MYRRRWLCHNSRCMLRTNVLQLESNSGDATACKKQFVSNNTLAPRGPCLLRRGSGFSSGISKQLAEQLQCTPFTCNCLEVHLAVNPLCRVSWPRASLISGSSWCSQDQYALEGILTCDMGIQGLLPVLKPITNTVHVSKYRGQKVAVDAYCWLHKAAYCCAEEICEGRFTDK